MMLFCVLPVDLWNDQRNVRIHSENRRVIDHGDGQFQKLVAVKVLRGGLLGADARARFARNRDELPRNLSAGAEEGDVDLVEGIFAEFFHRDGFIPKLNFLSGGPSGCEGAQF